MRTQITVMKQGSKRPGRHLEPADGGRDPERQDGTLGGGVRQAAVSGRPSNQGWPS
jgi:hypothetical protein